MNNPMNMRWRLEETDLVRFEFLSDGGEEVLQRIVYESKEAAEAAVLLKLKEADEAWEAKQVEIAPIRQQARRLRQLAQRLGHRV